MRNRRGDMEHLERVLWNDRPLAYIFRKDITAEKTTFLTPSDFNLQLGFVVYPAGGVVTPHVHLPLQRTIIGTSEVLFVKKGRCQIDIYNSERQLVRTAELSEGDLVLTVSGGHGFRMLEDTVLLEVKQGPYSGVEEKERFYP